jgi:DNA ligase (NAD+)
VYKLHKRAALYEFVQSVNPGHTFENGTWQSRQTMLLAISFDTPDQTRPAMKQSWNEVTHWQQKTEAWLNDDQAITRREALEELRDVLRFHEHRYYVLDDSLIADRQYDALYKKLEQTEATHPDWITADSPTQRVGSSLNAGFETVAHLVPMLSLENSYDEADLQDWDRKARELTGLSQIEYCVEPKFDGASISLLYENGHLVRSATRGDGVQGDDITTNSKRIRNIPLSAPFNTYGIGTIEIRGEVLLSKKHFQAFNEKLAEEGIPPLANPRNAASGSLRMKDPAEVGRRNLEAFLYHVSYTTTTAEHNNSLGVPHTHGDMLEMLWQCGFRSPVKEMQVVKGIEKVIEICQSYEQKRDDLPYEIDGMVIKVNDLTLQEKMGMTTHHPRWAIAFKFKARQATSKLRSVEFQVGRTGAVTPVAKIDPVYIGGVTVSSISIHNEEFIREKDLMIGDTVLVERAGDVIPQIVRSQPDLRTGDESNIHFPKTCPVCSSQLYKEPDEAVWRCVNAECEAQVVERIIHFISKDAMDIRSFGEQQVRKFYEMQLLKDIPGIYKLDFDKISGLEGYGAKSISNLREAIAASKEQPLYRLIFGLGIRHVGETMAKTVARAIKHILDLKDKSEEELMQLEDVGPKVAASIAGFFANLHNIHILHELESLGVNVSQQEEAPSADGAFAGKTFLFTGTLSKFKRSEAETLVEKGGGQILGGVSSKLNFLVVGEDAGSKLEKARKIPTVRILSEDAFLQMIQS